MTRAARLGLLVVMVALMATACYCRQSVNESQMGLVLKAGAIEEFLNPGGPYDNLDPVAEFVFIDVANMNVDWTDDVGLVTKDTQPIGLSLNVSFQRPRNADDLSALWRNYNNEAQSNDALTQKVVSLVPNAAKTATPQFTIWQMLGNEDLAEGQIAEIAQNTGIPVSDLTGIEGRLLLSKIVEVLLERQLSDLHIDITSVSITDVTPSPEFIELLGRRANAEQERQVVIVERLTNNERLASEQVQTQIELERADRQRQVSELQAQAYVTAPALLQIELAQIYAEAINEGDIVVFVPPGSDLAGALGQSGVLEMPIINAVLNQGRDRSEESGAAASPESTPALEATPPVEPAVVGQ